MLKKLYVFSFFLFAYGHSLDAQTLMANTYNNLFLGDFSVGAIYSCPPDPDFSITLDQNLIPYVNGITLVAVITALNNPQPSSTYTTYGPVSVGDTLPFDTTTSYPIWLYSGGSIEFEYRAVGVPTEVGEAYYCDFEIFATLGWCNNNVILTPIAGQDCQVLPFNSIAEGAGQGWELYPTPSHGPLRLSHKDGRTKWEQADLYDIQGRLIRHWEEGEMLSTEGLETGMYFLKFEALEEEFVMRTLVE